MNVKAFKYLAVFIVIYFIIKYINVVINEYKNDELVIPTNIYEIKVHVKELECNQGLCNQTLSFNNKTIVLKNQSRFNEVQKGKSYYLYYIIVEKENPYCVLDINAYQQSKMKLNELYTNKKLFARKCFKENEFFNTLIKEKNE